MKSQHVLFVSAESITIDLFIAPICEEMAARGIECSTASFGSPERIVGRRHYPLPAFRGGNFSQLARAGLALVRTIIQSQATLVVLNTPYALMLGRVAARVARVPSVAVIHGTPWGSTKFQSLIYTCMESLLARLSTVTVAVNREDRAGYARIVQPERVVQAPCGGAGVVVPCGPPRSPVAGARFAMVGRLTQAKDPELVLDAFALLKREMPNAVLLVAGSDDGWKTSSSDPPGVQRMGWVEDVGALLCSVDVLVSASLREGFGMATVEAVAAGVRVLSRSTRGSREVAARVPTHVTLFPTNYDPAELADDMRRLAALPPLRPCVPTEWERGNVVGWYADLYESLLSDRRA